MRETLSFSEIGFPGHASDFAYCEVLNEHTRLPCSVCFRGWIDWDPPLQIHWGQATPDVIADFTRLPRGAASLIVSNRMRQAVECEFKNLQFLQVLEAKGKRRIRFRPDPGPLWWLKIPILSPPIADRGWEEQGPACSQCGTVVLRPPDWSEYPEIHLEEDDLQGQAMFALDQFPGSLYVRADLRHFIMRHYFTGVTGCGESGGLIFLKEGSCLTREVEKELHRQR